MRGQIMEIKPVPKIIEDIGKLVQEEKYEEACSFGLENIDLNKKYIEGEYAFKNILEEYIFQFFKKGEIKRVFEKPGPCFEIQSCKCKGSFDTC